MKWICEVSFSSVLALAAMIAVGSTVPAAADDFSTLADVPGRALSGTEMKAVVGTQIEVPNLKITFSAADALSLETKDTGSDLDADIGVRFFHGGCPATTCGNGGQLIGWKGDGEPLPRGFDLPPGQ